MPAAFQRGVRVLPGTLWYYGEATRTWLYFVVGGRNEWGEWLCDGVPVAAPPFRAGERFAVTHEWLSAGDLLAGSKYLGFVSARWWRSFCLDASLGGALPLPPGFRLPGLALAEAGQARLFP